MTESNRMEVFDKCVDELLHAVTKDMLHVDNMKADLNRVASIKIPKKKNAELECIRKDVIDELKTQVKEHIDDTLKEALQMQDCFDSFQNTQLQQSKPWRINGVPQHDTYAQRRQVYLDYINRLSDAEKKLAKELKEYQQQISNAGHL